MSTNSPEQKDLLGEALQIHDYEAARQASEQKQEDDRKSHEAKLCPPDPEIDALCQDFARRMPESKAITFVAEEVEEVQEEAGWLKKIVEKNKAGYQEGGRGLISVHPANFRKRYERNMNGVSYDRDEITRGWPLRAKSISGFLSLDSRSKNIGIWTGLAIDKQGNLWLARDAFKDKNGSLVDPQYWDRSVHINSSDFTESAVAIAGPHPKERGWIKRHKDTIKIPPLGRPTGYDLRDTIFRFCFPGDHIGSDELPAMLAKGMAEEIRKQ